MEKYIADAQLQSKYFTIASREVLLQDFQIQLAGPPIAIGRPGVFLARPGNWAAALIGH